jgi:hypothetical protein
MYQYFRDHMYFETNEAFSIRKQRFNQGIIIVCNLYFFTDFEDAIFLFQKQEPNHLSGFQS